MDISLDNIQFALLLINHAALVLFFLNRYFTPGESTKLIIEDSLNYLLLYSFVTFFITFFAISIFSFSPILWLFLISFVYFIYKSNEKFGIALFALSIIQEVYLYQVNQQLDLLPVIYFVGIFVMIAGNQIIGFILKTLFSECEHKHIIIMKQLYGENAPRLLILNNGTTAKGFGTPANFVGMMIAYSIFMVLKYYYLF